MSGKKVHTERQKKLITSLERCSLKSTAIKNNHIWTQIRYSTHYEAHLKNQRDAFVKKEKSVVKSLKVILQKSQKVLAENRYDRPPIQNIQYPQSFNINDELFYCRTGYCPVQYMYSELGRQAVSVIFEKWPFVVLLHFNPFWLKQTFVFLCAW